MLQCFCLAVLISADLMMQAPRVADVPAVETDAELARQRGGSLPSTPACDTASGGVQARFCTHPGLTLTCMV